MMESTSDESARGFRAGTISSRVALLVGAGAAAAARFFFGTTSTVVAVTVTVVSYDVTVSVVVAMTEVPAYSVLARVRSGVGRRGVEYTHVRGVTVE